jgi:hypothetical protein
MENAKRPFEPPMLREETSLVDGTQFYDVLFSGSAT